jgi:hypothetical protein
MRFSKVIGLWIIALFMLSSVGACEVNASRAVDLQREHTRDSNVSSLKIIPNLLAINDNDTDTLSYSQMLDYLFKHDENQQPDYFIMIGTGGNPEDYRYKISNNIPDGFITLVRIIMISIK